jgi:hypothetical protein
MLYNKGTIDIEEVLNATACNNSLDYIDFLLDVVVDEFTLLTTAACLNQLDIVNILILRGANSNCVYQLGPPAFDAGCRK